MRNWVKSNNKPFKKTAATQAKSVKTEEGSKWSKRRTLWDRFQKRRRDGKKMKNFLNIARKRTRRQVLSCYMLNYDMAKKEKTQFAVKKRSWWNTSDRKQMKQQQQKKTRIQWSDFKGRCGKLEDLSRKEALPTARHNDGKIWANKHKNASETRKEQKNKRFNEYSKTSKESGTFQESNLQQEEYSSPRWRTRNVKSLQ